MYEKQKDAHIYVSSLVLTMLFVTACSGNAGGSSTSNSDSGSNSGSSSTSNSNSNTEPAATNADGKPNLSMVTEPVTLTWFSPLDSKVSATKKSFAEVDLLPLLEQEEPESKSISSIRQAA